MIYVEPISVCELSVQDKVIYVGFEKDHLDRERQDHKSRKLCTPFYGKPGDALLRAYTSQGEEYILLFKGMEDDFLNRPMGFLCIEDEGRLIVNANGRIYRFLVDDKVLVNKIDYILSPTDQAKYYTLSSKQEKIMVLATKEGLTAITWKKELWEEKFISADAGNLELVEINNKHLFVKYDAPSDEPENTLIEIDLLTGNILSVKER